MQDSANAEVRIQSISQSISQSFYRVNKDKNNNQYYSFLPFPFPRRTIVDPLGLLLCRVPHVRHRVIKHPRIRRLVDMIVCVLVRKAQLRTVAKHFLLFAIAGDARPSAKAQEPRVAARHWRAQRTNQREASDARPLRGLKHPRRCAATCARGGIDHDAHGAREDQRLVRGGRCRAGSRTGADGGDVDEVHFRCKLKCARSGAADVRDAAKDGAPEGGMVGGEVVRLGLDKAGLAIKAVKDSAKPGKNT